jgi:hypothetical protein
VKSIAITSVEALQAAINELNTLGVKCSLVANATPRAFYSNQQGLGKADYVIKLDNSRYDVGLYKNAEGGYEVRTDFWGEDVKNQLGAVASAPGKAEQAKLGKLFQAYGIHAAMQEARRKGLQASRQKGADGKEQVIITGYR